MPSNDSSATISDNEKSTVDTAAAQQPPPPPPPNGGLTAWIQVLGAHLLFFNSWWVNLSPGATSFIFLIMAKTGAS